MFGNAKIKHKKALVLQKMERDPDGVYVELKYHFVWNVINRRPVFHLTDDIFNDIYDIFLRCSELVGGFVNLLWLASDHLHLYVESDGELSVDQMVQKKMSSGSCGYRWYRMGFSRHPRRFVL